VTAVAVQTDERDAPIASPLDKPPEERGETDIRASAFAHMAERTALEVPGVHGVRTTTLPLVGSAHDDDRNVEASADVLPNRKVKLELKVGIDYPAPVSRIVEELRTHVIERVEALTGYDVDRLDIDVAELGCVNPRRRVI
jgi:uncharacterized alkaline shock family protein YloU